MASGYFTSTHGGYLRHIDQMRSVEWDKSYLWDVRFNDPALLGSSFNQQTWFPASDFTENSNTGSSLAIPYYMSTYKFPQAAAPTDITMSIYDDDKGTLYKWLTDWYDAVYDTSTGTMMLQDAVREMSVLKLNVQRQIVKSTLYYVYPEGAIVCAYSSSSEAKKYELTFSVAGSQKLA